jgi:hypothetical protein
MQFNMCVSGEKQWSMHLSHPNMSATSELERSALVDQRFVQSATWFSIIPAGGYTRFGWPTAGGHH